ncbi:MAG: hypothetical protein ACRDZ3_14405 [Acidimicrobiia bacterium]
MNNRNVKRGLRIAALALIATAAVATTALAGTYGKSQGGNPNFSALADNSA